MKIARLGYIVMLIVAARIAFAADSSSYFFVFLNPNPAPPQLEQDSLERLQAAHIESINRLYEEGRLVVSGPFADRQAGGIFIFKARTSEEVHAMLATDPAIHAKRYIIDVSPLEIQYGSICKASDIFGLEKYPFARLAIQKGLTETNRNLHELYMNELAQSKRILFNGIIGHSEHVIVFTKADNLEAARKLLMEDPAVRLAQIRPALRLWWNAPGVFCEEAEQ